MIFGMSAAAMPTPVSRTDNRNAPRPARGSDQHSRRGSATTLIGLPSK